KDTAAVQKAMIPVDRSQSAILLISGKNDRVWPASEMAEMVIKRLDAHKHPFRYRHLNYEGGGHSFGLPGLPRLEDETQLAGGTRKGNATAATVSWTATLDFLNDVFGK